MRSAAPHDPEGSMRNVLISNGFEIDPVFRARRPEGRCGPQFPIPAASCKRTIIDAPSSDRLQARRRMFAGCVLRSSTGPAGPPKGGVHRRREVRQ